MPRKTRAKSRKKKSKRSFKLNGWIIFQCIIIVLFCSAAFLVWQDHRVRTEFEGKKWSLPARVYSSPLELFAGLSMTPLQFEQQLQETGYQRVNQPRNPGEYSRAGSRITFVKRSFEFWDGREKSRMITLEFNKGQLAGMLDTVTGESIPVARLEPVLIGKIYPEHDEDRVLVAYDEVPPLLIDALIAVEDRNFFSHHGIDPKGILRAAWINLRSADLRQGGSTLTQQLVKNFYLTHERTLWRKFNEMIMAVLLEWHYSKTEILAAYINEIYLGQHGAQGVHGFGTAAEFYFSRPLSELKLEQLALLVALVRGASYYNPRKHPERALERRNRIIQQMYELGYVEEDRARNAQQAPLLISDSSGWSSARYPAFLDLVNRQLARDYRREDLQTEGLRIFTTLNPAYQEAVVQAVSARLPTLETVRALEQNTIQAAGIISSVETGEVLAMLGGRENRIAGFNRALDARRPIGSLIKPVIYLTALTQPERYNVLATLKDEPVSIRQKDGTMWVPDNYDGEMHGDVPLHLALEKSFNLATVRLGMEIGIAAFRETLGKFGITEHVPGYPSVYLGAIDLSPLQVTQMYHTLASNGFHIPLRSIREVLDKNGNPLQRYPLDIRQTLDNRPVFLTNYLLTRVVKNGTARSLAARMPAYMPLAGKTGTTNDLRDSWFAGFGDNLLGVIWLGRDDNKPAGLTGSNGALQVWTDIMQTIKPQPLTLIPPDGITFLPFINGKRVAEGCPGSEKFPVIDPFYPAVTPCKSTIPEKQKPGSEPWSIFDIFR